MPKMSYY